MMKNVHELVDQALGSMKPGQRNHTWGFLDALHSEISPDAETTDEEATLFTKTLSEIAAGMHDDDLLDPDYRIERLVTIIVWANGVGVPNHTHLRPEAT